MLLYFLFVNLFFLQINPQIVSDVKFLSNSSLFNDGRDGIVLLTLNTGEETTICNYKFSEIEAGIVCKSLGFPPHGFSLINSRQYHLGNVLIGNFQCKGNESHIKYCLHSGNKEYHGLCGEHKMDVHVYCTEKKSHQEKMSTLTSCKNMPGMTFRNLPNKLNTGFLQLESNGKMSYICNDQLNFALDAANFYCHKICKHVKFARPLMFLDQTGFDIDSNSSFVSVSCRNGNCSSSRVSSCDPTYVVGLKCGNEPEIIEKSPQITCTHETITIMWQNSTQPFINSTLVSISPGCQNATIRDTADGGVALSMLLGDCNPLIKDETDYVFYTYNIRRSYLPVGITLQNPANLVAQCRVIKRNQIANKLEFKKVTAASLTYKTKLSVVIQLYTDGSFISPLKKENKVEFNKLIFVKININNPPKDVKLNLDRCMVSPDNNFSSSAVVYLVQNMCPNEQYDVQLTYLNPYTIGFQFRPFNFVGKQNMQIYIRCETSKCYFPNDRFCGFCKPRSRPKRSILYNSNKSHTIGPIATI